MILSFLAYHRWYEFAEIYNLNLNLLRTSADIQIFTCRYTHTISNGKPVSYILGTSAPHIMMVNSSLKWAHPHLKMNSTQYFILPDTLFRAEAAPCVSHIPTHLGEPWPMGPQGMWYANTHCIHRIRASLRRVFFSHIVDSEPYRSGQTSPDISSCQSPEPSNEPIENAIAS